MMPETGIYILLVLFELRIAYAQSLKDKRRVVTGLKDRLSSRFNISIAELGELDNWHQTVIRITMIGNDRVYLEKQSSFIENVVVETRDTELLKVTKEWL